MRKLFHKVFFIFFLTLRSHRVRPEPEEIFEGGESHKHTVQETIEEKEDKELVVVEGDTVVHPGTVVVHLEDTAATHRTVVSSVRFDDGALLTVSHGPLEHKTQLAWQRQRYTYVIT